MKIDMRKAYDRLEWIFLQETLCGWGFLKTFTDFIINYVATIDLPFF